MALHISLTAEPVLHLGALPITNSMLTAVLVTGLLTWFAYAATTGKHDGRPVTLWHHLGEFLIEFFEDLTTNIAGKYGPKLFPIISSIFMFVLLSNWSGLIPGVGTIGMYESGESHALIPQIYAEEAGESGVLNHLEDVSTFHQEITLPAEESHSKFTPLFRAPTADLNMTLALALVAVSTIQVTGFTTIGAKLHISKFFNFASPIDFFVGILEFISEIAKILSFAFRLFGNILAGEILLAVIAYLVPLLASLPFFGLEIFVGFIQAYVFAILTLVFCSLATESHGEHKEAHI